MLLFINEKKEKKRKMEKKERKKEEKKKKKQILLQDSLRFTASDHETSLACMSSTIRAEDC